jgi:serine/threonine protein kinase
MDIYDLTQLTERTILSDSNDHDVSPQVSSSASAPPGLDIADVWQFVLNAENLDRFKPSKFLPIGTVYGIGGGACYRVDKGELNHEGGGRLVAIKHLKLTEKEGKGVDSHESTRSVETVLRELRILTHDPIRQSVNIVQLLGYGSRTVSDNISIYLGAEFAAHGTLREYLNKKSDPKVSITEKIKLCSDIANGLATLHACGVVQGDMKLENTLVCISDTGSVVAKLSDFGHSILDDDSRYIGTAIFNAPEVRSGRQTSTLRADHYKCDLFSYGLMVWETVQDGQRYVDPRHRENPITWLNELPKDDLLRMALLATQGLLPSDAAKVSLLQRVLESTLKDEPEDRLTVEEVLKLFNLERPFVATTK